MIKPQSAQESLPVSLQAALQAVVSAIQGADDLTVDQVQPLMARLVSEPARASEIIPRVVALLKPTDQQRDVQRALAQNKNAVNTGDFAAGAFQPGDSKSPLAGG